MALELGLMIEGQEGLTWERWRRLAALAEDEGFAFLFRSDHLTGLFGAAARPSLDAWASLTWLATATRRIHFGPMVCPVTFYHPAFLARRAAAVAELSAGRFELGIGAGWHEAEHVMFGIPFPPLAERLDRLACGARAIRALWRGQPVTLEQPYYALRDAQAHPHPPPGGVPLIIGGRGEKRTLRIVAESADEWNVTRVTFDEYRGKRAALEAHCRELRRDPATIRRSLMLPVIVGATTTERDLRSGRATALFPRLPADEAGWRAAGFLYGPPARIVEDLTVWAGLGVQRVMLQMVDMEDEDAMRIIAREVLPAVR